MYFKLTLRVSWPCNTLIKGQNDPCQLAESAYVVSHRRSKFCRVQYTYIHNLKGLVLHGVNNGPGMGMHIV